MSAARKTKSESNAPAAKPKSLRAAGTDAAALIDNRIASLADWRGDTLARMRSLILKADPDMLEEWKWMGTPVWSHEGNVCTGETYKQVVKLTFARGASLADAHKLFNSSLEGNTRRAIDIHEGEVVDAKAFQALIRAAVAENQKVAAAKSKSKPKAGAKATKKKTTQPPATKDKPAKDSTTTSKSATPAAAPVKLLSGGNPQIAKGDGDAPVQAYIAAMPGWKHDVGKQLDAIITRTLPNVRKAVKWNTPFYGRPAPDETWFLGFHCITRYIKVAFFQGASLRPVPPVASKQQDVRYFHIFEGDKIDEAQFASWVTQAAKLPGWKP